MSRRLAGPGKPRRSPPAVTGAAAPAAPRSPRRRRPERRHRFGGAAGSAAARSPRGSASTLAAIHVNHQHQSPSRARWATFCRASVPRTRRAAARSKVDVPRGNSLEAAARGGAPRRRSPAAQRRCGRCSRITATIRRRRCCCSCCAAPASRGAAGDARVRNAAAQPERPHCCVRCSMCRARSIEAYARRHGCAGSRTRATRTRRSAQFPAP